MPEISCRCFRLRSRSPQMKAMIDAGSKEKATESTKTTKMVEAVCCWRRSL